MNLSYYIAKRYLFSKKSHNAVNVISLISMCGIAIATVALVCMLSVFNGFTDLVTRAFVAFDPELQVTPAQGKVFAVDDERALKLKQLSEIDFISESLEENALLKMDDRQQPIVLKGVSERFRDLADFGHLIIDGEFELREGDFDHGVIGAGLAMQIGSRAGFVSPVEIYMPKRNTKVQLANPAANFTMSEAYISGVFALNQAEYDDRMLIVSIDLVRELLNYENEVSSLDIKLKKDISVSEAQSKIREILGEGFLVKDRFQQQESVYRMVNIEKWVTFLILAFVSAIAIFNVVGSLSILIIEKKNNIEILKNLGMHKKGILKIFMIEGWLITFIGSTVGLLIGLSICFIQQYFGILKLGGNGAFMIDAYPVSVQFWDVALIGIMVNIVGFLVVLYPVNALKKQL